MMDESLLCTTPPPQKDDKLFRADSDWETNGWLMCAEDAYSSGYRAAAFSLAQKVCESHKNHSNMVYPIVYLYRHHVELSLKNIMVVASALLDKELNEQELSTLGRHNLNELWENLKPLLNTVCELQLEDNFPPEDIEGIESYVTQLHYHDPDGQRFRYPTIKQGKRNCRIEKQSLRGDLRRIDIGAFTISMEKLAEYLEGIEWWFYDLLDIKNDMLRRFIPLKPEGE